MIITKKKAAQDILKRLKGKKTVHLFGCGSCAEQCRTGGERELVEMAAMLRDNGYEVTGSSLLDETCYNQLVRKEYRTNPAAGRADAVVVLACGAGVKTVASNADETQPILPALDTTFLAVVESQGRFFEGCSLCGECVLDSTGGICPHTECPKGLLNGPCGGVANGMCEVNTENECAWVRIYSRLKKQGRLALLMEYSPPKDHSAGIRPRKLCLR
ncbi:MAG: methylenetetrahydrofolate reductase C-terminal domain-containing protein [Deltaproteobacteria bacterium]|nr:methylenetetrahydrofolate reductase C-terminal domain-containing protein [Deltaproteobacteria bacterium]